MSGTIDTHKIQSKIDLLHYIHNKMLQKLEEQDEYCRDMATTLHDIEFMINAEMSDNNRL